VATGTCYEYAWPDDADCLERATPLATHTPYDFAKARCRAMIGAWAQAAGVEFAWARLFHLYGPGEHPERLVASVARALARGEPALCGSGAALRDFMDSREAGAAIAQIALARATGDVNVASGQPRSIADIARTLGRLAGAAEEFEFIRKREDLTGIVLDLLAAGEIPSRVTHNDTKSNNVMIDADLDQAVCVIDLDTVMPGSILYDFGDLVRSATSPAAEDETDLSKVRMQMPMYEALVEGYLDTASTFLNDAEIEHLTHSGKLMTLEVGTRFLTDYLEGDVYFKTHRPRHNLERCRTQLKLVERIEEQETAMQAFVKKCAAAASLSR
jgi:hypothetical protein